MAFPLCDIRESNHDKEMDFEDPNPQIAEKKTRLVSLMSTKWIKFAQSKRSWKTQTRSKSGLLFTIWMKNKVFLCIVFDYLIDCNTCHQTLDCAKS